MHAPDIIQQNGRRIPIAHADGTTSAGLRSGQALGICNEAMLMGADYKDEGRSASQKCHIAEI